MGCWAQESPGGRVLTSTTHAVRLSALGQILVGAIYVWQAPQSQYMQRCTEAASIPGNGENDDASLAPGGNACDGRRRIPDHVPSN